MQSPFPDQQQYGDRSQFDDSLLAGGVDTSKPVLMLLPLQTGGTATAGSLVKSLTSATQVKKLFGSVAAQAFGLFRNINSLNPVDAIGVAEAAQATAAAGSIKFTAAGAADGYIVVNLAGHEVQCAIAKSETAADQATALAAAIAADTDAPCTAAVDHDDTAKVNITYGYKGTLGNSARVSIADDDAVLGGACTIVQIGTGTPGSGDPDPTTANAARIEGSAYRIVVPLTDDSTTLSNAALFGGVMADKDHMQGAMWIFGFKGTYSQAVTAAQASNKPYILYGWLREAAQWHETALCAACIEAAYHSAQTDPSVPFHQQERVGLTTYPGGVDAAKIEIEYVVRAGASPYVHNAAGVPIVHTCVTTCTALADGTPSFELASPHKWYTAIFGRLFVLAARQAVTDTPEKKKMVDGFAGKLKGATVMALQTLAGAPYNWLSAAALATQIKNIMQAGISLTNLMRVVINTPYPIVEDYRGTDETIYLTTTQS